MAIFIGALGYFFPGCCAPTITGFVARSNTVASSLDGGIVVSAPSNLTIDGSLNATGPVLITSPDNLTFSNFGFLVSTASGNAIVLAAGGSFINDLGASALSTPNGRWLVYSHDPAGDTFGGLNSNNRAIWDATYASLQPGAVTQSGNHYLFAIQPTLTITTTNLTKTYGINDAGALVLKSAYTVSGVEPGVANAYLGDTLSDVLSGAPNITSAGARPKANVGSYAVDASTGSLVAHEWLHARFCG